MILKTTLILWIGFAFTTLKVVGQYKNYAEDRRIYSAENKIDHYPKNMHNTNESAFVFCQVFFKKNIVNDSIVVNNTSNQEIIDLIVECVRKIKFKKKYRKQSSIVIPYIFKNGDEFKNYNIDLNIRQINFQQLYGNAGSTEINSLIFIRPVIMVDFADRIPIR